MPRRTTVIPSAARLMTSLRDIGYDLPSAVADLVDNSIDAGARTVAIDVCRKGERSFIRIADDGRGMTERVLDEAMRYGSRRNVRRAQLGKFGLGLKTASLSQCRRLTVATRTTARGRIRIRRWDLDHVRTRDAWELERLVPSECPPYLVEPLANGAPARSSSGRSLTGSSRTRRPTASGTREALETMSESIAEHLSMVFHRFLAGETSSGGGDCGSSSTGSRLEPWDPFARTRTGDTEAGRAAARRSSTAARRTPSSYARTCFRARRGSRAPRHSAGRPARRSGIASRASTSIAAIG